MKISAITLAALILATTLAQAQEPQCLTKGVDFLAETRMEDCIKKSIVGHADLTREEQGNIYKNCMQAHEHEGEQKGCPTTNAIENTPKACLDAYPRYHAYWLMCRDKAWKRRDLTREQQARRFEECLLPYEQTGCP